MESLNEFSALDWTLVVFVIVMFVAAVATFIVHLWVDSDKYKHSKLISIEDNYEYDKQIHNQLFENTLSNYKESVKKNFPNHFI